MPQSRRRFHSDFIRAMNAAQAWPLKKSFHIWLRAVRKRHIRNDVYAAIQKGLPVNASHAVALVEYLLHEPALATVDGMLDLPTPRERGQERSETA